ncbi:MAG: phosphoserine phosphatase SerB [Acidimicrobiales bacterium]
MAPAPPPVDVSALSPALDRHVLVHVSGHDQPGVTAALMSHLAAAGAEVADVELITVRGRLHLSVLIGLRAEQEQPLLKELLLMGWQRGFHIDFEAVSADHHATRKAPWFAVTVLGQPLGSDAMAAATGAIAAHGANIERITCLARYPVSAYELVISAADIAPIREQLMSASRRLRFDVAVQPEGLRRRGIRLVALDVDSTLIQDEVIELLADEAGCREEVARVTAAAMAGELDFEAALRARVALLEGLEEEVLERARKRLRLTPGARTFVRTLKRLGFCTMIVSGGFTQFTDALKDELDLDYAFANQLEIVDGKLTGRVLGAVVDRRRKAEILAEVARAEGLAMHQTVAVGDGANDLDMLAAAGLGVAFNAKPVVADAADTSLNVPYLDAVLFVLGIRRDDVEAADAAPPDPITAG